MDFHNNIPLKNYTTIKLGGAALFMIDVTSAEDLAHIYKNAKEKNLAVYVLGGGSNSIARDEGFDGLVMRIKIAGFDIISDDLNSTLIKIGAGENWDQTVARIVQMRLSGVEAMSGIPGTVGAAPVQNVGAYGQEVADTLVSLQAYDTTTDQFVELTAADCNFSYRDSLFKSDQRGRFIITNVTLKLSKNLPAPPFYKALQDFLDNHQITSFTQQVIRDSVLQIRADKLPDPMKLPNAGSFFKNAIIEDWLLQELLQTYPEMPRYAMLDARHKIPSGWLIEQAGLKGKLLDGIRVYPKNALVLVNESAQSYADLASAREQIIAAVRDKFRIILEQEPLEIA